MIRLDLKPLPRHEDLARMVRTTSRIETALPLRKQTQEVNALSKIAPQDWDELFHAVESRLSASVSDAVQNDGKTRVTVLECVEALDQLHDALMHERQQRQQPPY